MSQHMPRLSRGAIISLDKVETKSIISFQYNPGRMTRTLMAKTSGGESDSTYSEMLRFAGAPTENISLEVEIDATDQIDTTVPATTGIYPQLSALEILLYPKSQEVQGNFALQRAGNFMIIPPAVPLILLVWGAKRVVPIRVTNFSITEEAYDVSLNPIRATVSLEFEVLNYNTLMPNQPGYQLFMQYQILKENMAKIGNFPNGKIF